MGKHFCAHSQTARNQSYQKLMKRKANGSSCFICKLFSFLKSWYRFTICVWCVSVCVFSALLQVLCRVLSAVPAARPVPTVPHSSLFSPKSIGSVAWYPHVVCRSCRSRHAQASAARRPRACRCCHRCGNVPRVWAAADSAVAQGPPPAPFRTRSAPSRNALPIVCTFSHCPPFSPRAMSLTVCVLRVDRVCLWFL